MLHTFFFIAGIYFMALSSFAQEELSPLTPEPQPLRMGVVGLTHDHVHGLLNRIDTTGEIVIVGIAEPNSRLSDRYIRRYNLDPQIIFESMDEMLFETKPEVVVAFNSIYEHLEVVRACAPMGIHVMVEKPLAINLEHAEEMARLSRIYDIHLLTNYETTWYQSHFQAYNMIHQSKEIGTVRKIVVHDGHKGPLEIGVSKEFLSWLTNPQLNGGGAIMDFGCYGANLATWLLKGAIPNSVVAVTQSLKPNIYPLVDDEASIILSYPNSQVIIQASWNWPFSRKDIQIYGETGYVFAQNKQMVRFRLNEDQPEYEYELPALTPPYHNPFLYFKAVVRGEIEPHAFDLSSLTNNIIVMQILDAAKESARTGKVIYFD